MTESTQSEDVLRYQLPRRLKTIVIIAACIFLAVLVIGLVRRGVASHQLAASTNAAAVPSVSIILPKPAGDAQALVLPGSVKAFYEAPIYAQVSGYLQSWNADIGTQVKAGQLLATISTPDLDQQLIQAQADLQTAIANERLAATTAQRWNQLLAKDAVSQQDADNRNGDYEAKRAITAAARANVDRLQAQEAFKRIVAPFDGTVTARNTDVGALISVGGVNQTPLFTVDDESRLRIYVSVPQLYSAEVQNSPGASFTVPEYPGREFKAKLVATASAINASTGTLLVQFQADNADHTLHPGDYAQVHISLPGGAQSLSVPSSALMFRDAGMEVAVLGPDNRVTIKPVTIARDLGQTVEISNGLEPGDKIINNPPDSLEQGDQVNPAPQQPHAQS